MFLPLWANHNIFQGLTDSRLSNKYPFPLFLPLWANHNGKFLYSVLIVNSFPLPDPRALQSCALLPLSGIAKRYGYQTVQDFYRVYHTTKNAYADYQKKMFEWDETYGKIVQKSKKESLHEQLQNYQRAKSEQQSEQITKRKDKGAR